MLDASVNLGWWARCWARYFNGVKVPGTLARKLPDSAEHVDVRAVRSVAVSCGLIDVGKLRERGFEIDAQS